MPTVTIWHANWCGPCKGTLQTLVPLLDDEAIPYDLVDVDWHPCAAQSRSVDYLPTITVDDGEQEIFRCRGLPSEEAIQAILDMFED